MDQLKEWAVVISPGLFLVWMIYHFWKDRKDIGKIGGLEKGVEKMNRRLGMLEMLLCMPKRPQMQYDPDKGFTFTVDAEI